MKRNGSSDHLSLDQWKGLERAGQAPEDACLVKGYVAEVKAPADDASRKVTFTISTGTVDRDRDTLRVEGWKLDNYANNPVVLWAHYYGMPPIGRAESMAKKDNALRATAEFATAEEYAFADTVFRLIRGGYLRATSVGFRPVSWSYNEDRRGYDFQEQELLEFSVVPVPANPEALMDAKAAGISLAPLRGWAEQLLDELEPGLWVPRSAALRVLEIASGERKVFDLGETKAAFVVQTLIFPKAKWDSLEACKEWAKDHDFRTDKVDETEESWRLRQRDPGDFKRLRTICINPGADTPMDECKVKAVGGPLKSAEAAVTKSGRVLSAYSEERIRKARDAADGIRAGLDEVLAQLEDDEDEDEKAAAATPPPAPPSIDAGRIRAAVRSAAVDVVTAGIRRAQGRLD